MKLYVLKTGPLALQREGEERMPMLVKSGEFERTIIWHMENKLLCYKQRWYILPGFLCRKLLRQYYNNLWVGHFNPCKTLELLQYHYYWPQMSTKIQEYMNICHACKLIKLR